MAIVKSKVVKSKVATVVQYDEEHGLPTIEDSEIIPLPVLTPSIKILLAGDTGSGKTAQLGLLAEYLYVLTKGKKTVLFTMDGGGFLTIQPLIDLGVIELVTFDGSVPPWLWISHALHGEARIDGDWVSVINPDTVVLAAYEGLTAYSEFMLEDLSRHSAEHPTQSVGGDSAWTYKVEFEGEELNMASNTQSHYGLVQMRIMHEIMRARPGVPSLWTAVLTRAADPIGGGILGPQTVGRAQAPTIPRLFDLMFRIDSRTSGDHPVKHQLYLETHEDKISKGAKVNVNARIPLSGGKARVELIFPRANIVLALQQLQARHTEARTETQARLARLMGQDK